MMARWFSQQTMFAGEPCHRGFVVVHARRSALVSCSGGVKYWFACEEAQGPAMCVSCSVLSFPVLRMSYTLWTPCVAVEG